MIVQHRKALGSGKMLFCSDPAVLRYASVYANQPVQQPVRRDVDPIPRVKARGRSDRTVR